MDAETAQLSPEIASPPARPEKELYFQAFRDRLDPHRLFLLLAPLLYAAYALLTPPFQSFDENQHLYRAWQISSLHFIGERRGRQSGGELPPGLAKATLLEIGSLEPGKAREIIRRPAIERFGTNTPIGTDRESIFYNFLGSVVYSPVGYVPQVIAIRIGKTAGLSVEWTLRLGRLFNVALGIGLVAWALRLLPFGRWIMLAMALSPPMAAGAASFGQDALVNGGGFLLTGLGLRVAVEKRWTGAGASAVGLVGAAIALAKFVYLPLVAIAALPLPRSVGARRWLLPPLLTGAGIAALVYVWMLATAQAVIDPIHPGIPSHSEQIAWAVAHPLDFSRLIGWTLLHLLSEWTFLYTFGDSTVFIGWAAIPGTAALVAMMAYGDGDASDLTRFRRTWMLAIVAAVTLLIIVAMFIVLTLRGATWIDGVQARYFLPVLPLGAIALMRRSETAPRAIRPMALFLVLLANAITLGTLMMTFYSF